MTKQIFTNQEGGLPQVLIGKADLLGPKFNFLCEQNK